MSAFRVDVTGDADKRAFKQAIAPASDVEYTGWRGNTGGTLPTFSLHVSAESPEAAELRVKELLDTRVLRVTEDV